MNYLYYINLSITVYWHFKKFKFNTFHEVFQRLQKYNIKLKAEKCEFLADKVVYIGFLLDRNGVHPTEEKVINTQTNRS